jgi:uncharacterized protein YukE
MSDYEAERQRIKAIQAMLREVREAMDPAWSGLADHPDMEGLNEHLREVDRGVQDALMGCRWVLWGLKRGADR